MFAGCLVVLGLYIVWNALAYGYMRGTTPGPGFFPFWVGLIVVLAASTGARASLDAAIVIALIGFLSTVAYATYVERGDPQ